MSDASIKAAVFVAWPFLLVPGLVLLALACVALWFFIPFARVVRSGKKFTLRWD